MTREGELATHNTRKEYLVYLWIMLVDSGMTTVVVTMTTDHIVVYVCFAVELMDSEQVERAEN